MNYYLLCQAPLYVFQFISGVKLKEIVGGVHNPKFPTSRLFGAQFADKYDFPWVLSAIKRLPALFIFGKCANKRNIGVRCDPQYFAWWHISPSPHGFVPGWLYRSLRRLLSKHNNCPRYFLHFYNLLHPKNWGGFYFCTREAQKSVLLYARQLKFYPLLEGQPIRQASLSWLHYFVSAVSSRLLICSSAFSTKDLIEFAIDSFMVRPCTQLWLLRRRKQ